MYTCANCTVLACANNEPEKMPKNCPMRNASVMEPPAPAMICPRITISTSTVRPLRGLATVNGPA